MATKKQNSSKKLLLTNIVGGLGYLSCVFQWLWLAILLVPPLLSNQNVRKFIIPEASDTPTQAVLQTSGGSSVVITVIAIAVTIFVLIATVVVLARLPIAVAKTGKKVIDETTEAVLPLVVHHRKIPVKKRRELTVRLRIILKLLLVFVPLLALSAIYLVPVILDERIVFVAGAFFLGGSLVWFSLEYALARLFKIQLTAIA